MMKIIVGDMIGRALRLTSVYIVLFLVSCTSSSPANSLKACYESLLIAMGDSSLSHYQRDRAVRMLLKSEDRDVIPVLIRGLKDKRIHYPNKEPISATELEPEHYDETVGMVCDDLLKVIVFGSVRDNRAYNISWDMWWSENSHRINKIDLAWGYSDPSLSK